MGRVDGVCQRLMVEKTPEVVASPLKPGAKKPNAQQSKEEEPRAPAEIFEKVGLPALNKKEKNDDGQRHDESYGPFGKDSKEEKQGQPPTPVSAARGVKPVEFCRS